MSRKDKKMAGPETHQNDNEDILRDEGFDPSATERDITEYLRAARVGETTLQHTLSYKTFDDAELGYAEAA